MTTNITRRYYLWRKSLDPKFSQTKLAAELGVSTRTIERWLAGSVRTKGVELRIRAAEEFYQAKMPR